MRRSIEPRVVSEGEVLFDAGMMGTRATRAQLVNLSRGGLCGRGPLPLAAHVEQEAPLRVALGLGDGTPPIAAAARVAWIDPTAAEPTFGLCFVDLSGTDRERLHAAVLSRAARAPATQGVRVRLDNGPVLRAEADTLADGNILLGAELPWLRLGAPADGEVDDRSFTGKVGWIGLHVGSSGAALLRVRIDVEHTSTPPARRDATLPYFSTRESRDEIPSDLLDEPLAQRPDEPFDDETGQLSAVAPSPRLTSLLRSAPARTMSRQSIARVFSLVRRGTRRRMRLALFRVAIVLLALSAVFFVARTLRQGRAVAPIDNR